MHLILIFIAIIAVMYKCAHLDPYIIENIYRQQTDGRRKLITIYSLAGSENNLKHTNKIMTIFEETHFYKGTNLQGL